MSGYTWIGFNLVLSLAGIAMSLALGAWVQNIENMFALVAFLVCSYWLHKTLSYWRTMLQVEDEVFSCAVKRVDGEG